MRTAPACVTCLAITGGAMLLAAAAFATGQPPGLRLLVAPADGDTVFYSVAFSWLGTDADGTVSLYRYAVDPPPIGPTFWFETDRTLQTMFFRSRVPVEPIPASGPIVFAEPHTLSVKAVDDEGLESNPISRAFVTYTISPDVHLTSPVRNPSPFFATQVGPSVTFRWEGHDWDGVFSDRPVRYKYRLLSLSDPANVPFLGNPELLRTSASAAAWAGWDSTSFDTTSVSFSNLPVGLEFLFAVVGFDEAGAYSARFSTSGNLMYVTVVAGLDAPESERRARVELAAPWPNPAQRRSRLEFTLAGEEVVDLALHDTQGRRVRTLASGVETAGRHPVEWNLLDSNGSSVAPGIYFVRLRAGGQVLTRKVLVAR